MTINSRLSQMCSVVILCVRGFYSHTVLTLTKQRDSSGAPPSELVPQRVHSGIDINTGVCPRVCCRALPCLCGSLHSGKLLTKCLFSLSLSLSLPHSGSTTSQGMFQHATNSRTWCMSLLLDQKGEEQRIREGGKPRRDPA